jgi:hypothetical protein
VDWLTKNPNYAQTPSMSEMGHFTQIPSGKADECNRDLTPIDSGAILILCGSGTPTIRLPRMFSD